MAIVQKPKAKQSAIPRDKAEAFIAGTGGKQQDDISPEQSKIVTTLRFDPTLLQQIDQAAKKRGVSRTAWIMMAASRAVEEGL